MKKLSILGEKGGVFLQNHDVVWEGLLEFCGKAK